MTASVHLRGIVIAGALAFLALALGFVTLAMNQTASKAAVHTIVPLKDRAHATTRTPASAVPKKAKAKPNVHLVAALKAGLPRSIAAQLAAHRVVIVELWSNSDSVGKLAEGEAKAGAALAGAGYIGVNVDVDGGAASEVTRVLGKLPVAPAALVYTRPGTLTTTLPGFNDRTVVQQAALSASAKPVTGSQSAT